MIITKLIEAVNDHTTRLEVDEHKAKAVEDGFGALSRYCQSEMVDIRGHLAAAVTDLGTAMQTIDATLRATMDAASQRFAECQRDDKELMMRTEAALTHLGAKVQELEQEAKKMKSQGGTHHEQSGHARDASAPQQHNRANVGHPDHSVPASTFQVVLMQTMVVRGQVEWEPPATQPTTNVVLESTTVAHGQVEQALPVAQPTTIWLLRQPTTTWPLRPRSRQLRRIRPIRLLQAECGSIGRAGINNTETNLGIRVTSLPHNSTTVRT